MMKAKVITLGCKVNQYESEAMLSSLLQHGFAAAEDKETADVVILNSGTVTAESDRKVRQIFRRAKKDNPDAVMVLTETLACKPDMLLSALSAFCGIESAPDALIIRNGLLGRDENGELTPLENL